jgi:predicted transcriptional regulator
MPRKRANPLTEREAEIMAFLWARGRATAEEVRSALTGGPHDSTVRTLLRVLETKGHVRHEAAGKVYVYRPVMPRAQAEGTALRNFLARFFGGSAEKLVLRLLEEEHLSAEELQALLRATPRAKKPRPEGETS